MKDEIVLGVYSMPAKNDTQKDEHHLLRQRALLEVFCNSTGIEVSDWGQTWDKNDSHEYVQIFMHLVSAVVISPVVAEAMKGVIEKLIAKGIDESVSRAISWIIATLSKKQKEQKIQVIHITYNGMTLKIDPPTSASGTKVTIDDKVIEIRYS